MLQTLISQRMGKYVKHTKTEGLYGAYGHGLVEHLVLPVLCTGMVLKVLMKKTVKYIMSGGHYVKMGTRVLKTGSNDSDAWCRPHNKHKQKIIRNIKLKTQNAELAQAYTRNTWHIRFIFDADLILREQYTSGQYRR